MQLRWDELNFETATTNHSSSSSNGSGTAGVASAAHQPPPHGVSRSRPSAARRAGAGARTRPAAAALAHPAIADSMQLLRALEEELPQMRRRSSSISSPMDSPAIDSPAFSSPLAASSAFTSSTKRSPPVNQSASPAAHTHDCTQPLTGHLAIERASAPAALSAKSRAFAKFASGDLFEKERAILRPVRLSVRPFRFWTIASQSFLSGFQPGFAWENSHNHPRGGVGPWLVGGGDL